MGEVTAAGFDEDLPPGEAVRANRTWWDGEAGTYQAEHAPFLAGLRGAAAAARSGASPADLPARLVWCPEGLDEADARLLGPPGALAGRRVLEVGAGAAQGSR